MQYIEASRALISDYQPKYLLAKDGTSSPHITVVQFDCESSDLAHQVGLKMYEKMQKEHFAPFNPPFVGVAFVDGVGIYEGTTWVELSVKRGEDDSPIMKVHYAALEALKNFNLEPLYAIGNNYHPHLTLARIIMPKHIKTWSQGFYQEPCNFSLELGVFDEEWQYAKTLETFPEAE